MGTETRRSRRPPDAQRWALQIAEVLPTQGEWTEAEYLWLTDRSPHRIELTDGWLELLPMPTDRHQTIAALLYDAFRPVIASLGGKLLFAALRVRIAPERFREPDLVALLSADDPRRQDRYWLGADLVVEIVSPDDPQRDTVDKRIDYAEAGIPEYWIVDPGSETITVLWLGEGAYTEHGVFARGARASSRLVKGLAVDVSAVFDAR